MILPASCLSRIRSIHMPSWRKALMYPTLGILLFSVAGPPSPALARADRPEPDWSLCESGYQVPAQPIVDTGDGGPEATYLAGDEADLSEEGVSTLLGNVQIGRGTQHVSADRVVYDKSRGTMAAQGNVQAWDAGQYVVGKSVRLDLASSEYQANDVQFLLVDHRGQGSAEEIKVKSPEQILTAKNATYTTCSSGLGAESAGRGAAKTKDWQLTARRIKLDRAADRGTARQVAIKFKDVPILYTPYLTFPLSDARKTGFLMPSFGVSEETGSELTVPFYWNIAPNQDATFALRNMSSRGTLLKGEYRYLTRFGAGKAQLDYLPSDDRYDNDYRAVFRFNHAGPIGKEWNTDINFNWVSDKDYLEDMGSSMIASSTRFLEQRADVRYTGNQWWALGRVQGYQTVDAAILENERPYDRLPQVRFGTRFRERNRKLNFQIEGEWVNFNRDAGGLDCEKNECATGQRLDITPSVTYPIRTPSAFLVPKLSLRHTEYNLDDTLPGSSETPTRTLPIFSLDGGLFLERTAHFGSHTYAHTLEPRVYYLAVPYKDQSNLPVFDTGEYTFNFGKMFRENRFSGPDRMSDANQVTFALTTRLLEEQSAEEFFRASIGQIRYLRDRKVYLPNNPDLNHDTNDSSEIIAEVAAKVARQWRVRAGYQYDVEDDTTTKSSFSLRYQPDTQRVFNVGYRYDDDYDEQATASFRWPLTRNWSTVGRWIYALPESQTVETVAGFEYNSCCWGARAVIQRFLNGSDNDFNNAFFLQLELKGLAGVGRKTTEFLTDIVPGYQNEF